MNRCRLQPNCVGRLQPFNSNRIQQTRLLLILWHNTLSLWISCTWCGAQRRATNDTFDILPLSHVSSPAAKIASRGQTTTHCWPAIECDLTSVHTHTGARESACGNRRAFHIICFIARLSTPLALAFFTCARCIFAHSPSRGVTLPAD
jgi:hypothetical protein